MGGTAILSAARIAAVVILALLPIPVPCAGAQAPESSGSDKPLSSVRIIEADLSLPAAELYDQLRFYRELGFNALLIHSGQAGGWSAEPAPDGPFIDARFQELVRWCAARGISIYVSLAPHADAAGDYIFADRSSFKRLRKFCRLLHRKAGIRDFVLSFKGAPLRLVYLSDIVQFGLSAAPAHLSMASKLRARLPADDRLWLRPAVSSDVNIDNPDLLYSASFLSYLDALDPRIGIVWSGPALLSPEITAAEIEAAGKKLGGRRLLLSDRYSLGPEGGMIALALALGPLRNREPAIGPHIAGYLYHPMSQRGGSRLTLLTVADFLEAPYSYDPEESWMRAIKRLAGDDERAFDALKTQATEWGGWILERNYRSALLDNPAAAAEDLRDPAAVARWGWTARRYRQRMAALSGLRDGTFKRDLLDTMDRRYAVARAIPTVRELRSRLAAGRNDTERLVQQLGAELREASRGSGAARALERFLEDSGLGPLLHKE